MSSSDALSQLQGLTIWRGEWLPDDKSLPEDKVGMHWATDPSWAGAFSARGVVHRAVIDDPEAQVIPPGSLIGGRGRDTGKSVPVDNFGPDREVNEVRLRPGAQIRMLVEQWHGQEEETVLPEGTHKTVEHPFRSEHGAYDVPSYRNLASQSVPGTPQQAQHAREEADFAAGVPVHE
jgi:hypothetical protein